MKKLIHYLKKILINFKNKTINNELQYSLHAFKYWFTVFSDFHDHFTQHGFLSSIKVWLGISLQWDRMRNFAGRRIFLLCG